MVLTDKWKIDTKIVTGDIYNCMNYIDTVLVPISKKQKEKETQYSLKVELIIMFATGFV